jgi:nucleoside-diphosphate-sugar epimerase
VAQVLVTGGAGFIGSNLVLALLKNGNLVRVLDNLSTGKQENLTDLDIDLVVGDIRDPEIVRKAVNGVDIIFHLAAFISNISPGSIYICASFN